MIYSNLPVTAAQVRDELDDAKTRAKSIAGRGEAIIAQAKAEARDLTKAEIRALDSLNEQYKEIEPKLLRLKNELAECERREDPLNQPQPRVATPGPINHRPPAPPPGVSFGNTSPSIAPIGSKPTFASLFPTASDPYSGAFTSMTDFCTSVVAAARGSHDHRLVRNAMSEGSGSAGGFLVPSQFVASMFDEALAMETIRPAANVTPMTTKEALTGVFDFTDGTAGARAGMTLTWAGEGSTLTPQDAKVREIRLVAKKASVLVVASNELIADSPVFDRQLRSGFAAAVAAGLDGAFLSGTGAGMPLGILNSSATITVSKVGSQTNDTLNLTNVAAMAARLEPASYRRAVWICHPTVLPSLYALSVVIRNAADDNNVGGSSAGVVQNSDGSLSIFGRPVLISEHCNPLGDKGDILLIDRSRYLVGLRADATVAVDSSRYFDSDQIGFRLTLRVDGQPAVAGPRKLRDGTSTVSPFIALEAR